MVRRVRHGSALAVLRPCRRTHGQRRAAALEAIAAQRDAKPCATWRPGHAGACCTWTGTFVLSGDLACLHYLTWCQSGPFSHANPNSSPRLRDRSFTSFSSLRCGPAPMQCRLHGVATGCTAYETPQSGMRMSVRTMGSVFQGSEGQCNAVAHGPLRPYGQHARVRACTRSGHIERFKRRYKERVYKTGRNMYRYTLWTPCREGRRSARRRACRAL